MSRYKFSANSSSGIILLAVKLCYCWYFLYIELKKWEHVMCCCDRLLVTQCLKVQFNTDSLLSVL